jgi:DNA-directed RNA polymerase subunit RPC12/RpoP
LRTPENVNRHDSIERTLIEKHSELMRMPVKKIYCSKCQRLVRGQSEGSNGSTQISCPRCGLRLWFWGSISWRSKGKASVSP